MILVSKIDLHFCRGLRDTFKRSDRRPELVWSQVSKGVRLSEVSEADVIYQFILDGIVSKFRIRFHSHLFQDPRTVRADRAITQREQFGNLARRFS